LDVPPVDKIAIPSLCKVWARSTTPVLSKTEMRDRFILIGF